MIRVTLVQTGVANLASVRAGLRRAGAEIEAATTAAAVESASHVVLPGVGAFGPGMAELHQRNLAQALHNRIAKHRPTLAICLGLHLLGSASEETPDIAGLGCFNAVARHFPAEVRAPQFGWNSVRTDAGAELMQDGYAYFANSYRLTQAPAGWTATTADHGGQFVAALERGPVLACQFHPELSGPWGAELLRRWLERGRAC